MRGAILTILILLGALNSALLISQVAQHRAFVNATLEANKAEAIATTAKAAQEIDRLLRSIMRLGDTLADDLSTGKIPFNGVTQRLASIVRENPDLLGALAAFQPYAFSPVDKLLTTRR